MARTQANRLVAVGTPLGEDVLLLKSFYASERLGRPFEFELEMLAETQQVGFEDILGQNVTVRLAMPDGSQRYFNGFVSRFSQPRADRGRLEYKAIVVPWIWFLTRTSDCRIFQEKSALDIIKEVFRDRQFTDFDDQTSGSYRKREYCVQYRETDFDFVHRLMEEEGICYFFKHENGKHTLVLADPKTSYQAYPGYGEIPYLPMGQGVSDREHIRNWNLEKRVMPGMYALNDYDFEVPGKGLLTSSSITRSHAVPNFEMYDYPGLYTKFADGQTAAKVRIEELQAQYEQGEGDTDAQGIAPGHTFKLTEFPRADQCRQYLITAAVHQAGPNSYDSNGMPEAESYSYSCSFAAIDAKEPFRPPRITPKPVVHGPQTAFVAGKSGDEILTDKHGRVKVQFHWDRVSKGDENSSCWIRVAQVWAGKGWGGMFIPRIGQEVIVDFLEGDPDRPIITGRVYNGEAAPPYALPANATMSTMKSDSSKGSGGFNEIRFEDKKGDEQLFIHAEKNQDNRVKNDSLEWVGRDRHLIVKGRQLEQVEGTRSETVKVDHMEDIGGDFHLNIKGKQAIKVAGTHSLTVTGDVVEAFQGNHLENTAMTLHLKGMGIKIEGSTGIELVCGGCSVVLTPAAVFVTGTLVNINSGSGPPVSPVGAQAASPKAPEMPDEATKADPGELTKVSIRERQLEQGKYGSATVGAGGDDTKAGKSPGGDLTWIGIELKNDKGNPVPNEPYEVELKDGTILKGTLDDKGKARENGLDPGSCKVRFPRLDKTEWRQA